MPGVGLDQRGSGGATSTSAFDAAEHAPDAMVVVNETGRIVYCNPRVEALLGYAPADLVGERLERIIPEHYRRSHRRLRERYIGVPGSRTRHGGMRLAALHRDGRIIQVDIGLEAFESPDGTLTVASLRDARPTQQAAILLAVRETVARHLTRSDLDVEPRLEAIAESLVRDGFADIISIALIDKPADVLRIAIIRHRDPALDRELDPYRRIAIQQGVGYSGRVWQSGERIVLRDIDAAAFLSTIVPDGQPFFRAHQVRSMICVPMRAEGEFIGALALARSAGGDNFSDAEVDMVSDVGDTCALAVSNAQWHSRLATSERMFRMALDGAPEGIGITDGSLRYVVVNDALCELAGRQRSWLLAHRVEDVVHADDFQDDLAARNRLLSGRTETVVLQQRWVRADGRVVWVRKSIRLLRKDSGEPEYYVVHLIDITHARRRAADMIRLARHDALTGVMNRHQLEDRLRRALEREGGDGDRRRTCVLFCDVDDFKTVNDRHGHGAGDHLLRTIAGRLVSSVRAVDDVTRAGGDEFVVIIHRVPDDATATAIAEKLREAVSAPVDFAGEDITRTVSIGIAVARDGEDPAGLLARADESLRRAKEASHRADD